MQNVIQRAHWPFSNSSLAASGFKDNDPTGLKKPIFLSQKSVQNVMKLPHIPLFENLL